ncbi:hypothetical protein [Streptomyces sp. NPDC126503]|uniref:hypothetical protein n=1 Tax=Streptomyces sp. NPDC126503 TaxID=3155315 RepID=UPI003326FA5A
MPDATVKISDGVREVTVEITGSSGDPLPRAEDTATRLYAAVVASTPGGQRAGFSGWALNSDTERSPEE